jgi:hypothetical protein
MTTKFNQTQTQTSSVEQIMGQIIDMLKLDPGTVALMLSYMRDDRFVMSNEGQEIIMTVGPIECDDEGYADIALTAAEALALAIRLIRHASELLRI